MGENENNEVKVKALVPCRTVGKSHETGSIFSLPVECANHAEEKGSVIIVEEEKKPRTRKRKKGGGS